jgi:hypothetical protein
MRRDPGIATECGMVRARSEQTVRALLKIHAECCEQIITVRR